MLQSIGNFLAGGSSYYLFIAIVGSTILVLQFIMSMAGLGNTDTPDADFSVDAHDLADIHGINFFSLKAIIAFVTFFGWGGFFWGHLGWSGLGIAFVCGVIMMVLSALVLSLMLKMQQSGNIRSADLVGRHGVVYLTIPADRKPGGLVTVSLDDRTRQVSARADLELKTGTDVRLESDLGGGVFLVVKA